MIIDLKTNIWHFDDFREAVEELDLERIYKKLYKKKFDVEDFHDMDMEEEVVVLRELLKHADGIFEANICEVSQQQWQFIVNEYPEFELDIIKHLGKDKFKDKFIAKVLAEKV
jgi:hypothetical protein